MRGSALQIFTFHSTQPEHKLHVRAMMGGAAVESPRAASDDHLPVNQLSINQLPIKGATS